MSLQSSSRAIHLETHGLCKHQQRPFSTTRCRRTVGHYKTLSLPRNASKSQIKSSYYKLSKLYHPDTTTDSKAKDKFQAVGEAYAVLGDDMKRRAYDRALADSGPGRHAAPPQHASYSAHWSYETRRRGATYAWEHAHPRRPGAGPFPNPRRTPYEAPYPQHPAGSAYPRAHHAHNPFSSPHVQRATGRKTPSERGEEAYYREADRVSGESTFWRTVQVIGVVLLIATVGGGFSAAAN